MSYKLRYERDPIWIAFHRDQDLIGPDIARFEPKYIWYLGTLPYAISPAFSKLSEAQSWFELKCCKRQPKLERRHVFRERRVNIESPAISFSEKYERRLDGGRRWIDQIAHYR